MSADPSEAYSLLQGLATELSAGKLQLPSLSDAVIRVRNTLSDPNFSVDRLTQLLLGEPVLAGSILTMANSVMFRRNGSATSDLGVAVSRLGASAVQSAAMTYAMRQLQKLDAYRSIEELLRPAWNQSALTAASSFLVSRQSKAASADEALVVGLLHNIGEIYLLSRAQQYPALLYDQCGGREFLRAWHPSIGKAIAEYWRLPESTIIAIERQNEPDVEERDPMIEVLKLGMAVASVASPADEDTIRSLAASTPARRLGLASRALADIVADRDAVCASLGLF